MCFLELKCQKGDCLCLLILQKTKKRGLYVKNVTTLILSSQPKQGLAKVRVQSEAQESHFMFSGVWENAKE